jgi:uncharacterized protein YciI
MILFLSALLLAAPPQAVPAQTAQATPNALFIVTYSPGPAWEAGKPMPRQKLGGHLTHMKALFAAGRIFAAGGFTDDGTEGGMMILRAANIDEARRTVAEDASVQAGVFVATVRAWTPSFDSGKPLKPTG